MRIHPHDLILQELAATFPEDRSECLDHLIECPACRGRFRQLLHSPPGAFASNVVSLERWQAVPPAYDPALDRVFQRLGLLQSSWEKERAQAHDSYTELRQYPLGKQLVLLRNSSRFHTWGLCDLFLRRSREVNFVNPALAENLAMLAIEIMERRAPAGYPTSAVESLRAQAWAYVANSRRVKADFRGAEEAFALAFAALRQGSQDPMDRAILLDLQASLLRDQRRFKEASALLRRAMTIFRRLGEYHRAGRTLVNLSNVHHAAGQTERSIPLLYDALELIDPNREPRLLVAVWHNLIYNLTEAGQFMAAQKLFASTRSLYQQFPERFVQNRRKWVEGRIAHGLGQVEQAEVLLLAARDGFLAQNTAYDIALVSLDLASLYAEQGRMAELKRIAAEMMPIFSSRQIHREALAALAYWKQAVEAEKACLDLVSGVASFLKRARHDPELRFERPE